jgi:hypothetical protein
MPHPAAANHCRHSLCCLPVGGCSYWLLDAAPVLELCSCSWLDICSRLLLPLRTLALVLPTNVRQILLRSTCRKLHALSARCVPHPRSSFSPSPLLPFSPSPLLPFSPSPLLPFSPSPLLPFPPSPLLPFPPSPFFFLFPSPLFFLFPSSSPLLCLSESFEAGLAALHLPQVRCSQRSLQPVSDVSRCSRCNEQRVLQSAKFGNAHNAAAAYDCALSGIVRRKQKIKGGSTHTHTHTMKNSS